MTDTMPVLFIGHGNPMNAVEDNAYSREWIAVGKTLPTPRAVLCISAHWETAGTCITAMPHPATLYDFHGFPAPLYRIQYPAPGDPDLARGIKRFLQDPTVHLDFNWGLDHGAWSVLRRLFPGAHVPVLQLSLDFNQPPRYHYWLGEKLAPLRSEGILILGSGNLVHNLKTMVWEDTAHNWALECDATLAALISSGDHQAMTDYPAMGDNAALAIPTNEHYLPLLYVLALQQSGDAVSFFCESVTLGSVSMRSLRLG